MRYNRLIAGLVATAYATGMFGFNPKERSLSQIVSGTVTQAGEVSAQQRSLSNYVNEFTLRHLAKKIVDRDDRSYVNSPGNLFDILYRNLIDVMFIQYTVGEPIDPKNNNFDEVAQKIIEAAKHDAPTYEKVSSHIKYVQERIDETISNPSALKKFYYDSIDHLIDEMVKLGRDPSFILSRYANLVKQITDYTSIISQNIDKLGPLFTEISETRRLRIELADSGNRAIDKFDTKWGAYAKQDTIDTFLKPDNPNELDESKINSFLGTKGTEYIRDLEELRRLREDHKLAARGERSAMKRTNEFIRTNFSEEWGKFGHSGFYFEDVIFELEFGNITLRLALAYGKDTQNASKSLETYEEIGRDLSSRLRKAAERTR